MEAKSLTPILTGSDIASTVDTHTPNAGVNECYGDSEAVGRSSVVRLPRFRFWYLEPEWTFVI